MIWSSNAVLTAFHNAYVRHVNCDPSNCTCLDWLASKHWYDTDCIWHCCWYAGRAHSTAAGAGRLLSAAMLGLITYQSLLQHWTCQLSDTTSYSRTQAACQAHACTATTWAVCQAEQCASVQSVMIGYTASTSLNRQPMQLMAGTPQALHCPGKQHELLAMQTDAEPVRSQ